MTARRRLLAASALAAALALLGDGGFAAPAAAQQQQQDGRLGALTIEQPWARPTAPGMRNGAAYLTLRNGGGDADRLVGATSDVAQRVEMHQTSIDAQGVASMRQVEAIEVPAGGEAVLAPTGLHLMLLGLKAPLADGTSFPLRLRFEHGGETEVTVAVGKGGGAAAAPAMDHGAMQHGTMQQHGGTTQP